MLVDELEIDVTEPAETGDVTTPETQEQEVEVEETTDQAEGETEAEGSEENTPTYQPDLTYKVGKDLKEFPEFLKSAITSKDVEDELRDLFTKADGLPVIKTKLDEIAKENDHYKKTWQQLGELRDTDPEAFFNAVSVPKESMLKVLSDQDLVDEYQRRKEFNELPDHAKHQINERNEFQVRERQMQRHLAEMQQEQHQMVINQFEFGLKQPEVNEVLKAYDSVHGEGAFRNRAIQYGDYLSRSTGRSASPQTVINAVMAEAKPIADLVFKQTQASQKPPQTSHQPPPSIPSVGQGGSASPAKTKIRSLDDLRAEAERRQRVNA